MHTKTLVRFAALLFIVNVFLLALLMLATSNAHAAAPLVSKTCSIGDKVYKIEYTANSASPAAVYYDGKKYEAMETKGEVLAQIDWFIAEFAFNGNAVTLYSATQYRSYWLGKGLCS